MRRWLTPAPQVVAFFANHRVQMALVGIGSFTAGAVLTDRIRHDAAKKYYSELAASEIEEAREYYKRHYKADEFATPASTFEAIHGTEPEVDDLSALADPEKLAELKQVLQGTGYIQADEAPAQPIPYNKPETIGMAMTVFEIAEPRQLDEVNSDQRKAMGLPYIINAVDYYDNENEYDQASYTWFEGDMVLTDETDNVITEVEQSVGAENLKRFGEGSNDGKMLYIRNDKIGIEYEIARSFGAYSEEVGGLELEHSDRPGLRKMRRGDDG